MDLLLVNSPSSKKVYQDLDTKNYTAIEQPVWAGLIANFVRRKGMSVAILDAEALRMTTEETAKEVIGIGATLTVFIVYGHQPSSSSQCMPGAMAVHEIVKNNSNCKTLFMGTHASALPEETLKDSGCDFVCYGEGPYEIFDLVNALKSKSSQFDKIPTLYYKDSEGNICHTERRALIQNLDEDIPSVAWDLLPMDLYRAHNWHSFSHDINKRQPYASLYTSLGCSFKCTFCCINSPFGVSTMRYLSAEKVLDELELLVTKYGVTNIKIPDEMFVLQKKHVLDICNGIIDRGFKVNIWAYSRIDTVQDYFLEKLKLAGFNWLAIGVEAANANVRKTVLKKLGDPDILNTIAKIRSFDINVGANYIFGLPSDTIETMKETRDLAIDLNTEWANFYFTMAYPGSPLHKDARLNNEELPETTGPGLIGYSQHSYESYPLVNKNMTRSELIKFRDEAHLMYMSNPAYLKLLESKFGVDAKNHIVEMNATALARKYV